MFEIDMNKEPLSALVLGVNLWEVRACRPDKSLAGDPKLVIELMAVGTETKLTDHIMLGGRGWGIGKEHLIALGVPAGFSGKIDPLDFIGRKVWLATQIEEREALATKGPNAGKMQKFRDARVDLNQLQNKGYQAESDVPPGATVRSGMGPDDTPF